MATQGRIRAELKNGGSGPAPTSAAQGHGGVLRRGGARPDTFPACPSVCQAGRWSCKNLPCPGTCALEGGSHITTFDGKKYTFHGDCYYVLMRVGGARPELRGWKGGWSAQAAPFPASCRAITTTPTPSWVSWGPAAPRTSRRASRQWCCSWTRRKTWVPSRAPPDHAPLGPRPGHALCVHAVQA